MRARPFVATKVHPMVRFSSPLSSEEKTFRAAGEKRVRVFSLRDAPPSLFSRRFAQRTLRFVEKTSTKLVRHRIIRIFAANYPEFTDDETQIFRI